MGERGWVDPAVSADIACGTACFGEVMRAADPRSGGISPHLARPSPLPIPEGYRLPMSVTPRNQPLRGSLYADPPWMRDHAELPADTPLICLLSAHRDHDAHIHVPEIMFTVPDMPVTNYVDLYGNRCRRWLLHQAISRSGSTRRLRSTAFRTVFVALRAKFPVPELPAGCLIYLMGSGTAKPT